ncbi:MAG: hypothetical protein CL624_04710 [Arcobacter sp.]|nr:hypothetical protein [Arcobacter sp.]|tara:strand:+ start:4175 stop:5143 length:969 start_codon:yes stop_codon:yes gene_type:complete
MIKNYLKRFKEDDFTIKIYDKFDENNWKLFLFCYKNIFREIEKKIFEWLFLKKNIFGILTNIENDYIGIYGLLKINLNFSGKHINSYLCHNVGVSEKYSGKGLFQYLGDKSLSSQLHTNNLVLGFPNKASKKGHLRLGWKSIAEVYFSKFESTKKDLLLDKKFEFKSIDKFETINFNENEFSLNVSKDKDYLNWRISKPNENYIKYIIVKNNIIQGYVIYKIYQNNKSKKLHLVDFNFLNIDVLNEIIKFSILKFKDSDCQILNTWIVEDTIFENKFNEYGFNKDIEMQSFPVILFQKEEKFDFSKIDKERIFFTLFDNDVF